MLFRSIVDESRPDFLFSEANRYLALPPGTLSVQESGFNRSMTTEEIALLLEINRKFPKERTWDEYEIFVRNKYVREITDHTKAPEGKEKLLTPKWAVDIANTLGAASKQKLISSGVTIIGDINSLDSAEVPTGSSTQPTVIDIKTVAKSMLVMDKKIIGYVPIVWLRQNLVYRLRRSVRRALFPKRS